MNDETPNLPRPTGLPVRGRICPDNGRTTKGSAVSHHTGTEQVTSSATARLVAALQDPARLFTGVQAAFLIAADRRWRADDDYERGVRAGLEQAREEFTSLMMDAIVAAQHVRPFTEGELRRITQLEHSRREADTAAAHPWRGDHPGGPVQVWEDPERGAQVDAYTAWLEQQPRVRP